MAQRHAGEVRDAKRNSLLAAVPDADHKALLAVAEPVRLETRDALARAGEPVDHVYFPLDCLASIVSAMEDGSTVEVGMTGRDGVVGVSAVLPGAGEIGDTFVQIAGDALRVPVDEFRDSLRRRASLSAAVLSYVHALMVMFAQNAACNSTHSIEQRSSRWLLMCRDRVGAELPLTHEFLAQMLAVRRASVTEVMGSLQARGLIRYHRGAVLLVDEKGLEEVACECYGVILRASEPLTPASSS